MCNRKYLVIEHEKNFNHSFLMTSNFSYLNSTP